MKMDCFRYKIPFFSVLFIVSLKRFFFEQGKNGQKSILYFVVIDRLFSQKYSKMRKME